MEALIFDHDLVRWLIEERRSRRIDRHDEIWDGTYVIMPPTDNSKQEMIGKLGAAFDALVRIEEEGWFYLGINVSDRVAGWELNLRCPDFAVYLKGNPAQKCGTHWCGGPDFAVEIVTPGDHTRDKLGFYGTVNTRELLVVDRHPWALELFRGIDGKMVSAGRSTLENATVLSSGVFQSVCSCSVARHVRRSKLRTRTDAAGSSDGITAPRQHSARSPLGSG